MSNNKAKSKKLNSPGIEPGYKMKKQLKNILLNAFKIFKKKAKVRQRVKNRKQIKPLKLLIKS